MKDRNEQLYRLHNVFTYKKNLESLKKIEDEGKELNQDQQWVETQVAAFNELASQYVLS